MTTPSDGAASVWITSMILNPALASTSYFTPAFILNPVTAGTSSNTPASITDPFWAAVSTDTPAQLTLPVIRTASDSAPAIDESFRTPAKVRFTIDDAAFASDSVSRPEVLGRHLFDTVSVPQDGATAYIPRLFLRTTMDYAPVTDQVAVQFLPGAPKPSPRSDKAAKTIRFQRPPALVGTRGSYWASDVPVSIPRAGRQSLIDFGGFTFTSGGLRPNVSEVEVEEVFEAPFFSPEGVLV